jgi:CDP-diacylglycerol--inositol 3-phosphatidyltransferase
MVCYFLSSFLDAFDGMAARYFNQSSTFGGMLDMLTDRIGTSALIMSIATFDVYKPYTALFQIIVCLDIVVRA